MNANELCVPGSALALNGEGGEAVSPEVGDTVEFTVRGKVSRTEGGNLYVAPETVNGEPVKAGPAGGGEMPSDPDAAMDAEMAGYQKADRAREAMLGLLLLALLWLGLGSAQAAESTVLANRLEYSTVPTNNWVASTRPMQVFSVIGDNNSGADVYLMVFDSATNKLAAARPIATVKVPSGSTGSLDWGAGGAPFVFGVNVAVSTTWPTLTNAGAISIMSVSGVRK